MVNVDEAFDRIELMPRLIWFFSRLNGRFHMGRLISVLSRENRALLHASDKGASMQSDQTLIFNL